jgi:hypothetical protein
MKLGKHPKDLFPIFVKHIAQKLLRHITKLKINKVECKIQKREFFSPKEVGSNDLPRNRLYQSDFSLHSS